MRFGAYRHLELIPAQRRTEDWAAWLKKPASSEAIQPNGVVADALDEFRHSFHGTRVVARNTERIAPESRQAGGGLRGRGNRCG